MRVITGAFKGRRLQSPTWDELRPSSGRLRETLFNVLADRVVDAVVLDACAGTGALGIEALSRGAREAVFVESDRRAVALIEKNLALCGATDDARVVAGALPGMLDRPPGVPAAFDLILVDPPYDDPQIDAILSALSLRLAPGGRLVLERARRVSTATVPELTHVRSVRSGDSVLDFYEGAGDATPAE
jgi:16S rRNA (guanine966-N2)-methyltransferase